MTLHLIQGYTEKGVSLSHCGTPRGTHMKELAEFISSSEKKCKKCQEAALKWSQRVYE